MDFVKVIYLEKTLNLLIEKEGLEYTQNLVESGEIKRIEELTTYLLTWKKQ